MIISAVEEKEPGRILLTITHTIEIEGQDKPACVAEALAMFISDTKSPFLANFVGIVVGFLNVQPEGHACIIRLVIF